MGEGLNAAIRDLCSHVKVPAHPLHITLLSASECKELKKPSLLDVTASLRTQHIYLFLPTSPAKSNVSYSPVLWNYADVWRKSVGLHTPKSYHITLSEDNDHVLDKSVSSYITSTGILDKVIKEAIQLGLEALDHLIVNIAENSEYATQAAESMICAFPDSYKGYLRLADAVVTTNAKLAGLAYAQALTYDQSLLEAVSKRIQRLSHSISYGPVVTGEEYEQIPAALHQYLLRPWPKELDASLSHRLWTALIQSRERNLYLGSRLPRFFSWLFPGHLAGMSTPRHAEDIDTLISMGFTHILTLTAEQPLNPAWFYLKPIQNVYIPLRNYGTPTIEEMDVIFDQICEGGVWLVHCGGGVGRAGTVLACLIAMFGRVRDSLDVMAKEPQMDAKSAISLLRSMRPRSLESELQEKFVSSFVSHRWKSAHEKQFEVEPIAKLETIISPAKGDVLSDVKSKTSVIFMVGKPGSGKSWLANAIAKRRLGKKTIIINQDTDSRATCERELGRSHQPEGTLIVLDRCNPKRRDRADWLKLVPLGYCCVVIYFDYQSSLCQRRINRRLNHPTIRPGRGHNALDQMSRDMEKPDFSEGFQALLVISSFQAAREALDCLTSTPNLFKFPRTPHLLRTGASTSDDIVLADFDELKGQIILEEKIDGANMGFSLDADGSIQCQNRSHWVCAADHAQYRPLSNWIKVHSAELIKTLAQDKSFLERFILFGEWVVAKHSIHYTSLPDFFLAFDMYDRLQGTFVSRSLLTSALQGTNIAQVPLIMQVQSITKAEVLELIQKQSNYSMGRREGVYIRFENEARTQTIRRGKVVRSDFIAGNEHWTRAKIVLNGIDTDRQSRVT